MRLAGEQADSIEDFIFLLYKEHRASSLGISDHTLHTHIH